MLPRDLKPHRDGHRGGRVHPRCGEQFRSELHDPVSVRHHRADDAHRRARPLLERHAQRSGDRGAPGRRQLRRRPRRERSPGRDPHLLGRKHHRDDHGGLHLRKVRGAHQRKACGGIATYLLEESVELAPDPGVWRRQGHGRGPAALPRAREVALGLHDTRHGLALVGTAILPPIRHDRPLLVRLAGLGSHRCGGLALDALLVVVHHSVPVERQEGIRVQS
mmetsp:Transcript_82573/g.210052  ORF Transcript_82573/g.210052 Transcript_82573/m.210052 type:complete len:221 (-) Transcript_82573:316-978(-)